MRRILGAVAVVLVAGVGYLAFTKLSASPSGASEAAQTKTEIRVEARTIENLVLAQGSLEPSQEVEIGFTVAGIVSEVNFETGDVVKAGDVLAKLDPFEYEAQLQLDLAARTGLEADMREATLALNSAKTEYERARSLRNNGVSSVAAFQTAERAYSSAQIAVDKINVELERIDITIERDRNDLAKLSLIAPYDGVLTSQPFQAGQSVSTNDNAKARVSNLTKLVNRAQVAEADISKIEVGMSAELTTLGQPNKRIPATVTRVDLTPVADASVVVYDVLLELSNPELSLLDGMTTQVYFLLGRAENVPTIPIAALLQRGGKTQVELKSGEMVDVTTGLRDRLYVEIVEGLKTGDRVMQTSGAGRARGGPPMAGIGGRH